MSNHIADAEDVFRVININPDFCKVNGKIVPFDIQQVMPPEKRAYSPNVIARDGKVLTVGSMIAGVVGNAGEGVLSGVSEGQGHTVMIAGEEKVLVNDNPVCRNGDPCLMNVKVG
jgi:hypothetical protein